MPAAARGSTDATLEGQGGPLTTSGGDGGPLTFEDDTIFGGADRQSPVRQLGPFLGGLLTVGLVVLTLVAAGILGSQEGMLVADRGQERSTATPSPTPPGSGGSVLLSATPVPPATPVPSLTPSPAISPSGTATAPCPTPPGWRRYAVQAGETWATIAARDGTTAPALQEMNCLPGTVLTEGQIIYVPWAPSRTPTPTRATGCTIRTDWVLYTVKQGDTLYSIATSVGISVYELKQANCLASDKILAGQQLRVPHLPWPTPSWTTTATRMPTGTPTGTATGTPTTDTPTPTPTSTPPTDTPTPTPSNTPVVTPTDTPVPRPSDTPVPTPSDTPVPPPSDTPVPPPSNTPVPPPTNTPIPPPSDTPIPRPSETPGT